MSAGVPPPALATRLAGAGLCLRHMANEAAKKRVIKNREVIGKYRLILLGTNVRATPAHWRSPLHTNAGFRRRRAGAVRALPRRVPVGHLLALAHGRVRSAPHRLRRRLVHADQGSGASVRPPPSTRQHPPAPPSTAAQHSCTRFGAHREGRAARRGCRREAQHSVPRVCAAGTRLSRTAVHSSAAAATSTRRRTHCNTHCG